MKVCDSEDKKSDIIVSSNKLQGQQSMVQFHLSGRNTCRRKPNGKAAVC